MPHHSPVASAHFSASVLLVLCDRPGPPSYLGWRAQSQASIYKLSYSSKNTDTGRVISSIDSFPWQVCGGWMKPFPPSYHGGTINYQ
eukprot:scaffold120924_cov39-Tisochrysis_lutea.AAC.1